ncbi:MAG TPA: POTRA domain-containing protein, partial [Bacteroidales bacterium]
KTKIKVHEIIIDGNKALSEIKIEKAMKKTSETGKLRNLFKSKKFIPEEYENDKNLIIEKYNELGYRDAQILKDSVFPFSEKTVDIYMKIEEGDKYYIRDIKWVGNTIYDTNVLSSMMRIKPNDVYNQKLLTERLQGGPNDEDAVANLYKNNGYLASQIMPTEVNVENDSVDLEIRVFEGKQFPINKIEIQGNDKLFEHVIRRELRTKPGEMYDQSQLVRSVGELRQTGQFNPETIDPQFNVNEEEGNVDIIYKLESKANDQVELSFGWGNTGVIGQLGFKFSNFAIQNLFKKENRKGIIPQGEGQTFRISAQTNGVYYQSYSVSFLEPWFGGKRPNSLSINAHYTYQTDVSSRYYNSSNNLYYYNYLNNNYNSDYSSNMAAMESDPNKYIRLFGVSVGSGRRLSWPDDFFTFYTELAYQNYKLSNWQYFLITDGSCHNVNLNFTLGRNSVFNPIFPRDGSTFSLSLQVTPPYSLFDGKDYSDPKMSNKEKFQFIEYHKWKFLSKTYTSLSKNEKLVLMTRADFGFVGYYNKNKKSPFETFSVGGDGMTGYGSTYAVETVGLRGYENGSLTSKGYGNAYSRLALELRYPIMLSNSSNIYALGFLEAGNAWTSFKSFNPFDLKRSAGIGLRIMLPMVGMLGIDYGYGFDKVNNSYDSSKSQFHFVIGQEF